MALALVFFGARYVPWAYQSLAMLVFAFAVLFLPQASRRCAVAGPDHALDGGGVVRARREPVQAFRRITFPLARQGVLAAIALVSLNS